MMWEHCEDTAKTSLCGAKFSWKIYLQ